ncbi:MAG TPA: hypothetical protein PLF63_01310 [Rubrivivax sp.]|jgi:hypothetical protein|nr:hypothetical protein [Rubrivivax sp.]
MTPLAVRSALAVALIGLLLAGCATTTVQSSGTPLQQPLCRADGVRPTAALYWMPQWRADQKEPQAREALARRGVERFVAQQPCLDITGAQRLAGDSGGVPDNAELLGRAGEVRPAPELALLVVVRELGPRLLIGLPVLVEGGTEVLIDVRLLRLSTAEVLLDSRTRWRNGGTLVIKGIGSLDADLAAALSSVLVPQPSKP